jgi:hypothetical protein
MIGDTVSSPMGFGGWAIGGPFFNPDGDPLGWGEADDDESIAAVRAADQRLDGLRSGLVVHSPLPHVTFLGLAGVAIDGDCLAARLGRCY